MSGAAVRVEDSGSGEMVAKIPRIGEPHKRSLRTGVLCAAGEFAQASVARLARSRVAPP